MMPRRSLMIGMAVGALVLQATSYAQDESRVLLEFS